MCRVLVSFSVAFVSYTLLFLTVSYQLIYFFFCVLFFFFFFFQAEDGIRDPLVTGVQTCALPIFRAGGGGLFFDDVGDRVRDHLAAAVDDPTHRPWPRQHSGVRNTGNGYFSLL